MRRLMVGDLSAYGMPSPRGGFFTTFWKTRKAPIIDRRGFVKALKERRFVVVPAVEGFQGSQVVLADGSRLGPNVVIAATGYRNSLREQVGDLGVVTSKEWPTTEAPREPRAAPGLYMIGFIPVLGGHIRMARLAATKLAGAIRTRLG
jgi:putative flavoprotein involved in K+ transport